MIIIEYSVMFEFKTWAVVDLQFLAYFKQTQFLLDSKIGFLYHSPGSQPHIHGFS